MKKKERKALAEIAAKARITHSDLSAHFWQKAYDALFYAFKAAEVAQRWDAGKHRGREAAA